MLSTPVCSPASSPKLAPRGPAGDGGRDRARTAEERSIQEFCIASDSDLDRGDHDMDLEGAALCEGSEAEAERRLCGLPAKAFEAREARLAVVGAAESKVRVRGVETRAVVELRRCCEEHLTERTRIEEEARTRRLERMAEVAELAVSEKHRTQRARDALKAAAAREAMALRLEAHKAQAHSKASMVNFFQWIAASLVGAVGATAAGGGAAGVAGAVPMSVARKKNGAASRYLSAVILVAFVRHLWLNTQTRNALMWSGELGPFFKGVLQKALKGAMAVLQEGQAAKGDAGWRGGGELLPLLGPCSEPGWVCRGGPGGRVFWHHTSLGPAPWELPGWTEPKAPSPDAGEDPLDASGGEGAGGKPRRGRLGALLANWGLGRYAEALESNGYDPETLRALSPAEAEEMLGVIGCTAEDAGVFRRAIDSWS